MKIVLLFSYVPPKNGMTSADLSQKRQYYSFLLFVITSYSIHYTKLYDDKNIPKKELLDSIDRSKEVIVTVLNSLSEDQLAKDYPIDVFKKKMTTSFFLIHLHSHLNYHLGQINYHRRLLDRDTK